MCPYPCTVAAGVPPAVEGGVPPPENWLDVKAPPVPPDKMPGSTAGQRPAATAASQAHRPNACASTKSLLINRAC